MNEIEAEKLCQTAAEQAGTVVRELFEAAQPSTGAVLVVGCSSSEVSGGRIGHDSNADVARALFDAIYTEAKNAGVYLAAQCCEHLNRALVVERELAEAKNWTIVCAVPQVKAGGGFATAAYRGFADPVLVENISADMGLDIGQTLIGMHLKAVAVPVRVSLDRIGSAVITCARTRPKYIGGSRAVYEA